MSGTPEIRGGHGSKGAVYSAIVANTFITIVKVVAFFMTGSGAMLSEAIHSFADLGNQSLLAIGIHKSERPPDDRHPYGYGREQFVWALIAGVGIFFLGCGVTLYHGVMLLVHPHEVESVGIAIVVLLLSFAGESWSWWVAIRTVRRNAGTKPFWHYVFKGPDPMAVAVLLEDTAALAGIVLALLGVAGTRLSGLVVFDAIATILIGLLLGGIAIFIIYKNKSYLVGRSMPKEHEDSVRRILASEEIVESVDQVRTAVLGPESSRFKAEINFNGRVVARKLLESQDIESLRQNLDTPEKLQAWLEEFGEQIVEGLGDEIDRIEDRILREVPAVRHVELETE